ncbi:MAG: ribonuclease HI family protein [Terriglobia bacterium]
MPNSPEIVAHIDGGSRGNPGPAAYGVAIETAQGQAVTSFARFIGRTTNNFAEYQGLLAALDYALSHGYPRLRVLTDSELMARQISGQYKVRSPDLKPLHDQARAMIARLESFSIRHVYREHNREADRLANEAMDNAARGILPHEPAPSPRTLPAPRTPAPQTSPPPPARPLSISATFQKGVLHPHTQLPLLDSEEVELEIRRKK